MRVDNGCSHSAVLRWGSLHELDRLCQRSQYAQSSEVLNGLGVYFSHDEQYSLLDVMTGVVCISISDLVGVGSDERTYTQSSWMRFCVPKMTYRVQAHETA
ncbi:hypothetical protein Tco_0972836 [Tanacetum coccineum]